MKGLWSLCRRQAGRYRQPMSTLRSSPAIALNGTYPPTACSVPWTLDSTIVPLSYAHLIRLTDDVGMLEHAMGALPKREHGYCADDNARALIVVTRAGDAPELRGLADRYLAFLRHAYRGGGQFLNRFEYDRTWDVRRGETLDDGSGRALWALGIAAIGAPEAHIRWAATELFTDAAVFRSHYPRSAAFAAVGACELLAKGEHDGAEGLAKHALAQIGLPRPGTWMWPEDQLTYANALLPHALISVGFVMNDAAALDRGLAMLHWLVDLCTSPDGHLSVCPSTGWTPTKLTYGGHQQPIEVSTLADAAAAAYKTTTDGYWLVVLQKCIRWFLGENDGKSSMIDPSSGGGYDALQPDGVNQNQGAESTLAMLSTVQHADLLATIAAARAGV